MTKGQDHQEWDALLQEVVTIGQRRFKEEIDHAEMGEQASALTSDFARALVSAESDDERLAMATLAAETCVTQRFTQAKDVFDIEEALIVGNAVIQALAPLGGSYLFLPGRALVEGIIFVALPRASNPETHPPLLQTVATILSLIKEEAEKLGAHDMLAWMQQLLAD